MLDGAVAQPLQNWFLSGLGIAQQGLIDEAPLLSLGRQIGRAAQIRLVSQHNEKFCLLTVAGVFNHPRRDLVRRRKVALDALTRRLAAASRSTGSARLCRRFGREARGSDSSHCSYGSCDEEQSTQNTQLR